MSNEHVYTGKEVRHMREIAFAMAQMLFEKHMPNADKDSMEYRVALFQYAESLAQTYIMAAVSPDGFNQEYIRIRD